MRCGRFTFFATAILLFVGMGRATSAADVASPLEPAEAQRLFQLADDDLAIELAAAEPDVVDPVAIRFDEAGRMWVVEMRDYPLGPPAGQPPLSRIRILTDGDGDGRYETATTFAEGLSFVTGLQPWKGGAFVTLSGAVVYMRDTNGDGRSDEQETWFEGFAEQNSQLRANHPRLALDNWIYVANGLRGGKVVNRKLADQPPIDISGMDFRFDPLTGKAESVSGNGQFGLCFDDWGNRFTCSNRNPCRHVVIEDRYLKANPAVTVPGVMHDVAAFAEHSRIFPISRAWTTSNLHAGQFTAACGVYIYRGDLLPERFRGNVFTCDPTGNLIHREIMQPSGPTFTSKPAYDGKEFLASPDEWFRPVNMELGPDGALYVVDMYRCVIEHPDFVPDELKRRPDQRLGDDRGRIWRIVAGEGSRARGREAEARSQEPGGRSQGTEETNPTRKRGNLHTTHATATSAELVKFLEHPNAWQRETASRLLLETQDAAITPKLRDVVSASEHSQARACALWLLAGLSHLQSSDVQRGLSDSDPLVRRQAILVSELLPDQPLAAAAAKLIRDNASVVRFQAWLMASPGSTSVADLLVQQADLADPWMRAAAELQLSPDAAAAGLVTLLATESSHVRTDGAIAFIEKLAERSISATDAQRNAAVDAALEHAINQRDATAGLAALKGLFRGMSRRGINTRDIQPLASQLPELRERLKALAVSQQNTDAVRQSALEALSYLPESVSALLPFIAADQPQPIRLAAIAALTRQTQTEVWQALLDGFAAELPPVRRAILEGVLANVGRISLLLESIEKGRIKPAELDANYVTRLSQHRDPEVKARALKLFASLTPADRAQALADYQPVLALPADARRGQVVFEKNCAACHKIGDVGVNVAPDISDSRTKTPAQLLADILQPNRAIDNNYIGYNVRLADGTVATGILAAETATSITLRQQGGKELVIPRSDIEELRSSGQSLMPEGLERQIPQPQMADLIAFIKNWRYLDGRTPLEGSASRPPE